MHFMKTLLDKLLVETSLNPEYLAFKGFVKGLQTEVPGVIGVCGNALKKSEVFNRSIFSIIFYAKLLNSMGKNM